VRKVMVFLLMAMIVGAMATGAFADHGGVQTGQGKNNPCPDPDPGFCPDPVDPTASLTDQTPPEADPLFIGADDNDSQGLRAAVAIGDEDQGDSVGRLGVAASEAGGVQVYGEDYTDGDAIADAVEGLNEATGCALLASDNCDPGADDPDDAALITIH
jgi:hypothetical protein